ncbi:MAG: dimethyl sulfoxide reductase anchor subunit [Truepera sp.]|nr:dimethyl sulfoxide reductase anchor subunit [Truepera sp.]
MPAIDWSLTIFTIIIQMVLGAFAVLWVTDLLARQLARPRDQEYLTAIAVWVLGPLLVLGLLVTLTHLGRPIFAFRALANLETSWLSREIFFLGAFLVLGAGYAALWWRWRHLFALRATLGAVAGVVGAAGLVSMVFIYLLPAQPTWNLWTTFLEFLGTALLLGPLLVGTVFVITFRRHEARATLESLIAMHLRYLVPTVIVGAVLAGVGLAGRLLTLPQLGLEGVAAYNLLVGPYGVALAARWVLLVVGGLLLPLVLARQLTRHGAGGLGLHVAAMLVLVAASEILGRVLFYAAAVPIRPPGPFFYF